jgi:hypothetical protein
LDAVSVSMGSGCFRLLSMMMFVSSMSMCGDGEC